MEKYKVKINDDRLTIDMERIRSGKTQLFRKDYGDRKFIIEENADVVLTPPSKEMYAELINNVWYWVKGCNKCKDSMNYGENYSYQVCYEHDRCINCGTHRENITDTPWGHKDGFICNPCNDILEKEIRQKAFDSMPDDEDYSEYDYYDVDDVLCPHCGTSQGTDDMDEDNTLECYTCKGNFSLTVNYSVSYSTSVIGERLKK